MNRGQPLFSFEIADFIITIMLRSPARLAAAVSPGAKRARAKPAAQKGAKRAASGGGKKLVFDDVASQDSGRVLPSQIQGLEAFKRSEYGDRLTILTAENVFSMMGVSVTCSRTALVCHARIGQEQTPSS